MGCSPGLGTIGRNSMSLEEFIHFLENVFGFDLSFQLGRKYILKVFCEVISDNEDNLVLSFGGYYSNHILATAAAASRFGLKSIGIIRGEQPSNLSPTLQDASGLGMQLFFSSRKDYQEKKIPDEVLDQFDRDQLFIIPEGGYGIPGMQGASDILKPADISKYT